MSHGSTLTKYFIIYTYPNETKCTKRKIPTTFGVIGICKIKSAPAASPLFGNCQYIISWIVIKLYWS